MLIVSTLLYILLFVRQDVNCHAPYVSKVIIFKYAYALIFKLELLLAFMLIVLRERLLIILNLVPFVLLVYLINLMPTILFFYEYSEKL